MFAVACANGDSDDGEKLLRSIALGRADVGSDYMIDSERTQTNEQAALARADTEQAREQYDDWGQMLAYNVQFAPPPAADLVFSGRTARIMNTVTLFDDDDGGTASLAYLAALSEQRLADVLHNDGAGTRLDEIQVNKDLDFPDAGDESFAWRFSGKATFETGLTSAFVADSVFVRVGRVTGNVTTVALGSAPSRAELEALVRRFVEKSEQQ